MTPKQHQAVLLLVQGNTIVKTAEQVGCSEKTIDLWKRQASFREALRQAKDDIYAESLSMLKKYAADAIECLVRNMDPDEAAPYVQVQAASKILDAGLQVTKVQELEKLLAELEARLQE